MTAKMISTNISCDLKKLIWLNTILFVSALSAVSVSMGSSLLLIAVIVTGTLAGITTQLYIKWHYAEKTETKLTESYNQMRETFSFDELTEVYNRKAGNERLKEEFARATRTGEQLSIAMVDADNFKMINDTYGHQAGDKVLKSIATTIKNWLRTNDIVFRYGGEEFLIIMPDTGVNDASVPLERLREKLSEQIITYGEFQIKSSVSIGVATALQTREEIEDVIERADSALYDAKRSGKNQVVYHDSIKPMLSPVAPGKLVIAH